MNDKSKERKGTRDSNSRWVAWIAIGVGVFMVVVGSLLLLWGLSYQAGVGENTEPGSDPLVGGPVILPAGVLSIAFGALWINHGLKGFRKDSDDRTMKNCPSCGKRIEEDLNFCYHCMTTFEEPDDEGPEKHSGKKKGEGSMQEKDEEGLTRGQRLRLKRQSNRKEKKETEKRASSLDEINNGR